MYLSSGKVEVVVEAVAGSGVVAEELASRGRRRSELLVLTTDMLMSQTSRVLFKTLLLKKSSEELKPPILTTPVLGRSDVVSVLPSPPPPLPPLMTPLLPLPPLPPLPLLLLPLPVSAAPEMEHSALVLLRFEVRVVKVLQPLLLVLCGVTGRLLEGCKALPST